MKTRLKPGATSALALLASISVLLAACSGQSSGNGSGATEAGSSQPAPGENTDPNNTPPTIAGTPVTEVTAGQQYSFQATAADANGDVLAFKAEGLPDWITLDSNTGWFYGMPEDADAGKTADIVVSVTDGKSVTSMAAFSVNVTARAGASPSTPGTAAPTISGTPLVTATANTAYAFTPTANDPDTLTLTYSIANKPSWASFSTATGKLSGTPTAAMIGNSQNIVISVSDGAHSAALPAFSIAVSANTAANVAPVISGTPASSVVAGAVYSFMPKASDPNGDTLAFSSTGKPAWATFNVVSGGLTGTPTVAQVGSYGNIVITASDGKLSTSLTTFSINVTQNQSANGSVTLSWTPPTQNTDGSNLTDLAGYYIHYGSDASSLTNTIKLSNPGLTSYVVSNLGSSDTYFAMTTYSATGAESAYSSIAQYSGSSAR